MKLPYTVQAFQNVPDVRKCFTGETKPAEYVVQEKAVIPDPIAVKQQHLLAAAADAGQANQPDPNEGLPQLQPPGEWSLYGKYCTLLQPIDKHHEIPSIGFCNRLS